MKYKRGRGTASRAHRHGPHRHRATSNAWSPRPRSSRLKAHPIPGAQRTAIGITGTRAPSGPRPSRTCRAFSGHPGLASLQARFARVPSRGHDRLDRASGGRTRRRRHGGAVRRRDPRADRHDREGREGTRRASPARQRVQNPRVAVLLPGLGEEASKFSRKPVTSRAPVVTEVLDTATVELVALRGLPADRRAQHAEFRAPEARGPLRAGPSSSSAACRDPQEFLLGRRYVLAEEQRTSSCANAA